jgi:hypothetical protein
MVCATVAAVLWDLLLLLLSAIDIKVPPTLLALADEVIE